MALYYNNQKYNSSCGYGSSFSKECQIPAIATGPTISYLQVPKKIYPTNIYPTNIYPTNIYPTNINEGYVCEPGKGKKVTNLTAPTPPPSPSMGKSRLISQSPAHLPAQSPASHSPLPATPSPNNTPKTNVTLKYEDTMEYTSTGNPNVWGPTAWFFFHTAASQYPLNPSFIWKQRTKQFIQGIPVMLPCEKCMKHATAYIESYTDDQLNEIVSSKDALFNFFYDFHNTVNKRLGKGTMSLEDAKKLYNGTATVSKLSFGPS